MEQEYISKLNVVPFISHQVINNYLVILNIGTPPDKYIIRKKKQPQVIVFLSTVTMQVKIDCCIAIDFHPTTVHKEAIMFSNFNERVIPHSLKTSNSIATVTFLLLINTVCSQMGLNMKRQSFEIVRFSLLPFFVFYYLTILKSVNFLCHLSWY